jgi:hypothetical protein
MPFHVIGNVALIQGGGFGLFLPQLPALVYTSH